MSKLHHQQRRAAQGKLRRSASLNLVSLMDIFTILVFFLMVNSSEVEVLQASSSIKLPDSTAEKRPDNQLTISVNSDDVVVQGRAVVTVADAFAMETAVIPQLATELEYLAARKGAAPEEGFEVTIMGDRELPYWLLKKIMLTCQATDFARMSLAVNKIQGADLAADAADPKMPETAARADAGAGDGRAREPGAPT